MSAYLKASIKRSYAEGFLKELERNDNQYFFFTGRSIPWTDDTSPPIPGTGTYPDTDRTEREILSGVVGYKKLDPKSILFVIPRYEWLSGTVYDQYDDAVQLFDTASPKIFYVVTDENRIYKCISRPALRQSTIKPSLISTSAFTLSDGYTWKYMATIRDSDLPYQLTDYVPVDFITLSEDTESSYQYNTQSTAVSGQLTRCEFVTNGGVSAAVYADTQFSTSNAQLKLLTFTNVGGVKKITLDSASSSQIATPTNKVGYIIKVAESTTSPTTNNQYAIIQSAAVVSNLVVFTVVDDAVSFTPINPDATQGAGNYTKFDIVPHIRISGDGVGAYAFPIMDSTNKIIGSTLISNGQAYSKATASVTTSISTQPTKIQPTFNVVLSPKGGHGNNILKELNAQDIIVVVKITTEDSAAFAGGGNYRQFGIIKNPILNDGSNSVAGSNDPYYQNITLLYDGVNTRTKDAWKNNGFGGGVNNFIIGAESSVGSSIASINSVDYDAVTNTTKMSIKAKNIGGNYITKQSRPNDYIFTMSSDAIADAFSLGEKITQTTATSSATGNVLKKSGKKITATTKTGAFVVGSDKIYGINSGASGAIASSVSRNGEYVRIFDDTTNTVVHEGTTYDLFKIVEVGSSYFDLNQTPSYTGLTVLVIGTSVSGSTGGVDTTSAALTQNSYSNGDFVQQGVSGSATSNYASATVYRWDFINASKGNLYVTNVFGDFKNIAEDGINGSTLGAFTITSVVPPQIDPNSGEVIYINNIRPISRVNDQSEEFRIRLGF